MSESKRKIEAIYELRQAAEEKARAEKEVDDAPSAEKKDRLLETQLKLEEKTVAAITLVTNAVANTPPARITAGTARTEGFLPAVYGGPNP